MAMATPGNNRRSAVLPRLGDHPGQAAEQRYQHVVNRGRGPGQQFAAVGRQGRNKEIEGRGDDGHDEHQRQVAQRLLKQLEVVDAQGQPGSHDGTHDGRDEHGADDDGGRIDIEPQRGYHRGENQHPQIDAAELDPLGDGGHHLVALGLVLVETETVAQELAPDPELLGDERPPGVRIVVVRICHFTKSQINSPPLPGVRAWGVRRAR